jgi:hypothetical protein
MEENTKVIGKMESNMEMVNFSIYHLEYGGKVYGMTASELDGLHQKLPNKF